MKRKINDVVNIEGKYPRNHMKLIKRISSHS